MNADTINELDALARGFIDGEVKPKELYGLAVFDLWAVTTLGAIYSCTKVGNISQDLCMKLRFVVLNRYEHFKTRTVFLEKEHKRWLDNTARYSSVRCALAKKINSGCTDLADMLRDALEIIDALTREDVYVKMYDRAFKDKDFKQKALLNARAKMESYEEMFGELPYAKLIERFYAQCCEDRIDAIFRELDIDSFRKQAARAVPKKDSEQVAVVAENLMNMYGSVKG